MGCFYFFRIIIVFLIGGFWGGKKGCWVLRNFGQIRLWWDLDWASFCLFWTLPPALLLLNLQEEESRPNFSVFSKLCSLGNCLWNHYDSLKESFQGKMVLLHSSCIGGCGDQFSCGKSIPLHFCNQRHAAGIVKQSRVP